MVTNMWGDEWKLADMKMCVGKGWGTLIERLHKLCDENDIVVAQVKEKFGGLRFYIGGASMEIHNEIEKVENESYKICESCGEPGETKGNGWIKTLCDECRME